MNEVLNKEVKVIDLGTIDYQEAWDYQEKLFKEVIDIKLANRDKPEKQQIPTPNYLLFCEHPHVYTLGKSGSAQNLLLDEEGLKEKHASYYKINRGGDITYHGPGQLVCYPILDLDNFFEDIHKYLRLLEEAIIKSLSHFGVKAGRIEKLTGVWIDFDNEDSSRPRNPRKICAMGVRSSRWVTMHGLALNVNTNLEYFGNIIPCGIDDKAVTSMEKELAGPLNIKQVQEVLQGQIGSLFQNGNQMKRDIPTPEVKNVTVVIKPEQAGEHWTVHLVNTNEFALHNILVASEGYGKKEPNRQETSKLRQFFEVLEAQSSLQIELIDPKVFHLFNEYGVTYYINNEIYFKKFVFVPDSILEENLIFNTILNSKVVTHS